ncbi:MAG TPA: alpha/beta hydrolase [Steroidobacteraceae bacterium]|nr:alpha/beta hydrolase [Steroidobacteraceae bacterium]
MQRVTMVRRVVFGAAVSMCTALVPAQSQSLSLQDCRIESAAAGGSLAARCGTLDLPENRDDPNSRKIGVHVAVVPALRVQALRDPLFVLAGGPGQGASDFYASVSAAFGRIRRDRDIVLVDQRGTGRSNRLDCAFEDEPEFSTSDPTQLEQQAKKCLAELSGDPRYYTTSIAVRDLEAVRQALRYDQLNIYAVSYGTRVAQHYLRRFPDRVRTMVLDGAVPVDLALGPDVAIHAQSALEVLFSRCEQDAACNDRFANVRDSWSMMRDRLQRDPLRIDMPDPLTAQLTAATMGVPQLSAAVRLLTYSDETASVLPLLIHRAQVEQQPQSLIAQYLMIKRSMESQIAYGMHFSVTCSEDAPRWDQEKVSDDALARTYLGRSFMQGLRAMCEAWPRGPVDADFNAPLESATAVLVLSGENDPVTPKEYGDRAARSYQNGKHVVLRGQGHGQLGNGCMPRVVSEFVRLGSVAQLDVSCTGTVTPAPFMLSTSATAP